MIIMIGACPEANPSQSSQLEPFIFDKTASGQSVQEGVNPKTSAQREGDDRARRERYVKAMGELHTLSARHFTTGLNSYFFALCVIAWFLNAWVFMAATIWVSLVLYRRAFRSEFLKTLIKISSHN